MSLASLLGFALGLIPGFHSNLLANLKLSNEEKFQLAFASLFSSIFPASRGLTGRTYSAALLSRARLRYYLIGAIFATSAFILLYPFYPIFLPLYKLMRQNFFWLLPSLALLLILREGLIYGFFFLFSGIYGFFLLNSGISVEKALLVHFSAMFGLLGMEERAKFSHESIYGSIFGTLAGILLSFLPTITVSQAIGILALFLPKPSAYYSLLGSAYISSFLFCFLSLKYFGKGRSLIVEQIGEISPYLVVKTALISSALFIAMEKLVSRLKIPDKLGKALVLANMLVFGQEALIFAPFSWLLAKAARKAKAKPSSLLGSLMLPTILYYITR